MRSWPCRAFEEMDTDENGVVSMEEFVSAVLARNKFSTNTWISKYLFFSSYWLDLLGFSACYFVGFLNPNLEISVFDPKILFGSLMRLMVLVSNFINNIAIVKKRVKKQRKYEMTTVGWGLIGFFL